MPYASRATPREGTDGDEPAEQEGGITQAMADVMAAALG
jgi:hypothetical protein